MYAGREDGKTRFISRNLQGTKRQDQTALATLLTEVELGQVARSHPITVAELVTGGLGDIALCGRRMNEHRRCVEHDLKAALGPLRVDKPMRPATSC